MGGGDGEAKPEDNIKFIDEDSTPGSHRVANNSNAVAASAAGDDDDGVVWKRRRSLSLNADDVEDATDEEVAAILPPDERSPTPTLRGSLNAAADVVS